jgi:DNA-binding NarL/FixJ family response regulator
MRRHGTRGRPPQTDVVTTAEWQVVEAVRHGLTNPGIAKRLGVSTDAVKFHVGNALHKLGFSSRRELRLWHGVRHGSSLFKQGVTVDNNAPSVPSARSAEA